MTEAYFENDYVYADARIRCAELSLIDKAAMETVIAAKDAEEATDLLLEKGYGNGEERNPDLMFSLERAKLWDLVDELVTDKDALRVFRLPADYNNLKAAIKEASEEEEIEGIYIEESTVDPETVRKAVRERSYNDLPGQMSFTAREAHDVYLRTKDGQMCDILVDRACLDEMLTAGKESGDDFVDEYARLFAAAACVKTAVRAAITKKDREFLDQALCDSEDLNIDALKTAVQNGIESVCAFLGSTDYAEAVPELRKSVTAFERWCDNHIIEEMRSQLYNSFGIGPVAAYIIAKETEMKSLRIILSAKENGFPETVIRERVRETYV